MGLFKFCKLPFGFTNAGVLFSYAFNIALQPVLEWVYVTDGVDLAIYVDDTIACSKTIDGLMNLTHRMFKALQECKLKRSKIQFSTAIDVLSFHIENGKFSPQVEALTQIIQYKEPSSLAQLRRWCCMVTYYAHHVPDLQRIMAPLARLLKKDVEYELNQSCREPFDLINKILSKQPCLTIADGKKELFLEVDSSLDSCAAVLLRKGDSDKLVPVAYYGKRFQLLKKPSLVTVLELKGIVAAIRHFKGLTNDMGIITDHKPLLGMLRHGNAEELFQYLLVVEEAECRIKYQQGSKMYASDALSRMHIRRHLAAEGGSTLLTKMMSKVT